MPTVLRLEGYRFYFYSHEPHEPPHVHVDYGNASAKFWLERVTLASNTGFPAHNLNVLQRHVQAHRDVLLEAWHGHFGARR